MNLPQYDDLPLIEGLGLPHAWDAFGRDDDLGSIGLLKPERRRAAAALVTTGEAVNLTLPLTLPDPPLFGRKPLAHDIYNLDRNTLDDSVDGLFMQASSQWDGLRHIRAREHGYWTGIPDDFGKGPGRLGIEHWVEHGIAGCGALLDVGAHLEAEGRGYDALQPVVVTAADLDAAAERQGLTVEPGDVLCIRFGWVEAYMKLSAAERADYAPNVQHAGLEGSAEMAKRLWDWHPSAIVCDNPAVEVVPGDPKVGSLHRRMIPLLGMAFAEMADFSGLAPALAARGEGWRFMFTSSPLHLPGAIGSPLNAMALL